MERLDLEFRSDENLISFHAYEFKAIYYGEVGYEILPDCVRSTAKKQGLLSSNFFPTKQRLTEKAISIMKKHGLLDTGSDTGEPQT